VNLGAHAAFIVAAYVVAAVVVIALIVWVVGDHRAQRRTLAELERAGAGRRAPSP
jgi:heme exporter protein D